MASLDHWHPVLLTRELKGDPVGVSLAGEQLAVFRTRRGVAALTDVCPHRGMRLSTGKVEAGRLVCPYHGYAFDAAGEGTCPSTPKRRLQAKRFDAVERYGAIWVKSADSHPDFPRWGATSYVPMGSMRTRVNAPLELVLDNFTEVEHTPTTHALLGYALEDMPGVSTELELTEDSVRVINVGRQKKIPRPLAWLFGFEQGDDFVDDWTTCFSPVFSVYHHYWRDPATGQARPDRLITAVFFTPQDAQTTDLITFVYGCGPQFDNPAKRLLFRPLTKALVALEIERDRAMLGNLADRSTSLKGKKLSRFDKALAENRKRLDRIYYAGAKSVGFSVVHGGG